MKKAVFCIFHEVQWQISLFIKGALPILKAVCELWLSFLRDLLIYNMYVISVKLLLDVLKAF